ncbi:MAG TPA: hypothetical protein VN646_24220 [Candidatus Acidoferrum sp.]|nr:hypothetical protein [Candidatus Acidoferrum sp.]
MRLVLPAILMVAAALRLWRLDQGGFHGLDPIVTPEKLGTMVSARQVRFVMLGDLSVVSRRLGAETAGRPVTEWVRANGAPVDPALWRAVGGRRGGMQLYDLRPGGDYLVGRIPIATGSAEIE